MALTAVRASENQPRGRRGTAPAVPACRRCIVSGEVHPKADLIRFVAGPDGAVVPDIDGQLPGRGLWLLPRRALIEKACERNLFSRAAKAPLQAPSDLAQRLDQLLVRRCLDLIGLAKRGGQAVSGYEKVSSQLAGGKVAIVFQAMDAAEGGRRKLQGRVQSSCPGAAVFELFTAEELGRALGQESRVHLAIAPGGVAARLSKETTRLATLRGQVEQAAPMPRLEN